MPIFLLAVNFAAFSQTYKIRKVETFVNSVPGSMNGVPGDIFSATLTFSNTGAASINVFVDRYAKSIPPFWSSCYCYIQCADPSQDTLTLQIPAYSYVEVTLPFKNDSVNPGIATSSFKIFQVGYEVNADTIHLVASTLSNLVGIPGGEITEEALIFPNPAGDFLHINHPGSLPATVTVTDLSGKIVEQRELNDSRLFLFTGSYPSGVYVVEIKNAETRIEKLFLHP
jgi:hypothetical protein